MRASLTKSMHQPSGTIAFGKVEIGAGRPVALIAEIGVNHEGGADACGKMIEAAARNGADLVKLQVMDADANYAPGTESHALFARSWIEPERVAGLFRFAREIGVEIFATVGDAETLEWIDRLAPAGYKISSGLLTHLPLISRAALTGRPLMMSTGMAEDADIVVAIDAGRGAEASGIVLLHCTSIYPAPDDELHLAVIPRLAERFGLPVGFSDHSLGIDAAVLAAALGAVTIEKHFTLDAQRPGFDHQISLEPTQFAAMAAAVRRAERMRGKEDKPLTESKRHAAITNHRYIAAGRGLAAGEVLVEADIAFLRLLPTAPRGFAPGELRAILGRRVRRPVAQYTAILPDDLEAR